MFMLFGVGEVNSNGVRKGREGNNHLRDGNRAAFSSPNKTETKFIQRHIELLNGAGLAIPKKS